MIGGDSGYRRFYVAGALLGDRVYRSDGLCEAFAFLFEIFVLFLLVLKD
nr:MAG TPA: hypothetical protein [Caudoviricetes sp.]